MQILREPVSDQTAWSGSDLEHDRSWERVLSAGESAALRAELALLGGRPFQEIERSSAPAGLALAALAREITAAVRDGRGFVVVRGFPVEDLSDDAIRAMYWRLGLEIGTPVTQDGHCALIADVKERHETIPPGTRHYGGMREAKLHVDLTDVVGLLCVRQAPSSPLSTLASAATLHNAILAQHPEWLPRLYEGFQWDRMSEQAPWEPPVMPWKTPVFSYANGQLSSRFHRGWIRAGANRLGQPLTDEESGMLDFIDQVLAANCISFQMDPGDVYFASNYTVLHGRAAYQEEPDWEVAARRLFFRIWLNVPNIRAFADEASMRFGAIRHGNLGWTSRELAAGKHLAPGHERVFCETR